MQLAVVTSYRRVARGFGNWMRVLEGVASDGDDYWDIAGEDVRFRPLPGIGRTEFWVGRNPHAAVQINVPTDPRSENGLAALATDVGGNEYIIRQGVLHKNGASGRIGSVEFQEASRLEPVHVKLGDIDAVREWFVVTRLTNVDGATVARNTAEFVRQCWVARGQTLENLQVGGDASPSAEAPQLSEPSADSSNISLPSGRVWVTSFWGFNPEGDGYFGFTREGDRTWFLRQWRPGDLVMVYATMGDSTEEAHRGRVMGFLEVEPRTIRDTDRMSPEGRQWKVENRVTDRWTYALPVVRAWRAVDLPEARSIAPTTLGRTANLQLIGSRGMPLQPDEAAAALAIPVRPVDVYGQLALAAKEREKIYVPSRGFPMSFGKRAFETKDGAHVLYVLQLDGDIAAIMGEAPHLMRGKIVVKVGLAKDPDNRCGQHNACLPPAAKMRWKLLLRSRPLPDGEAALAAETVLKESFSRIYRSLGGEFFLCDEKTLAAEFAKARPYPGSSAH